MRDWMYLGVTLSRTSRFRSEPIRAKCWSTTVTSKDSIQSQQTKDCGCHGNHWFSSISISIYMNTLQHLVCNLQSWARLGYFSIQSFRTFKSLIWHYFRWMCRIGRTKGFPGERIQGSSGSLRPWLWTVWCLREKHHDRRGQQESSLLLETN